MKLIVAAMEEEVKAIVDHMDQVRVCSHAGVRLYEGMLEGEACTVMKSGVGKGSCAMTLTIALERLGSVDAVINIGTAGGILDTEEACGERSGPPARITGASWRRRQRRPFHQRGG